MLRLTLLALAVATTSAIYAGPHQGRIVGGTAVPRANHPYLAITYYDGVIMCAGSLIAEQFLVTAAHCSLDHPDITVVFGVENLADPHDFNNWQTIENATIFPHPDFNITTRHNDIAVIKVPYAPAIVPGVVELAALPEQGPGLPGGIEVTVAGYGKESQGAEDYAGFLKSIQEFTIPNEECAAIFPTIVVDDIALCASAEEIASFCEGDSGGPALTQGTPDVIQGVVSFGYNFECGSGYPDGFARVSNYVDWINQVIAENS